MDRPSAIYESEKQMKALADVLEGKEYKNTSATNGESKWLKYIAEQIEKNGVGGSSIRPDWNQNDETADDYIKNRPFYEIKSSTTYLDGIFEFMDFSKTYSAAAPVQKVYGTEIPSDHTLTNGGIYTVIFDNVEYKCNAMQTEVGVYYLGNLSIENPNSINTKEPFAIGSFPDGYMILTTTSEGNHSVSIVGDTSIINKIPEKYLPDGIGSVQSDWNQTDATAKDYIKNKPTLVQSDWNQTNSSDLSYIKNKPTIIGRKANNSMGIASGERFNNYNANKASGAYSHAEGTETNASGDSAHAEGSQTTASGAFSHSEGSNTTASGNYAHAEGADTIASGLKSHSEGSSSTASGSHSHAEGFVTIAGESCSHAEGDHTIASSSDQHVQGRYNIEDTSGKYAHIVGNGSDTKRSNAHTLDWSGNAWYEGTVEGTAMIVKSSTSGSSKRFKITVDDSGVITATEITA